MTPYAAYSNGVLVGLLNATHAFTFLHGAWVYHVLVAERNITRNAEMLLTRRPFLGRVKCCHFSKRKWKKLGKNYPTPRTRRSGECEQSCKGQHVTPVNKSHCCIKLRPEARHCQFYSGSDCSKYTFCGKINRKPKLCDLSCVQGPRKMYIWHLVILGNFDVSLITSRTSDEVESPPADSRCRVEVH